MLLNENCQTVLHDRKYSNENKIYSMLEMKFSLDFVKEKLEEQVLMMHLAWINPHIFDSCPDRCQLSIPK